MFKKKYVKKSAEEKKKEVEKLVKNAQKSIEEHFDTPENIKEYLSFMSKFHNYSLNNTALIQSQFPGALAVGSFALWKKYGFNVNKGEKGIRILVPNKTKDKFKNENDEWVNIDKATKAEKEKIIKGEVELRKGITYFTQGYTFDITQTNAKLKDLPKNFSKRWLEGSIKNFDILYKGMEQIASKIGVNIIEPKSELGAARGVSYPTTKEVALNPRNSQLQNVKTLLHELTHAKLHDLKNTDNYTDNEKEFQAELTAYTVCSYFGIDTSEYSINYLKSWTKGKDFNDKKKLLMEIKETATEYIDVLENTITKEKFASEVEKKFKNDMKGVGTMKTKKDEKEIRKMIAEHEEWLNTNGIKGKQLNLEDEDLKGLKFLNLDLRNSNFKNADISNCIIYADLRGANLTGAKINNTKFLGSNLSKSIIEPKTLTIISQQIKEEETKHKLGLKGLRKSKQNDIEK